MGIISKPFTFSAGATIIASEHNSDFDTIYTCVNGNLTNANINASAAITYSKLSLTGGIVNADVSASAAIVASKLSLISPGAIGSTTPSTGAFTTLKVGTIHQGDILYDNGTSIVRLTPGTSGYFLTTAGASANPSWTSGALTHSEFLARLTSAGGDGATADTYDLTGGFTTGSDFAPSAFTVPTTGKYFFNVYFEWTKDASATLRQPKVNIRVGGVDVAIFTLASTSTSGVDSIGGNILLSLTATNAVTTVCTSASGTFTTSAITKSWFSGFLIR